MRLPVLFVRRADIPGIVFAVSVAAILVYVCVAFPGPLAKHMIGSRLGPDWTCQYVASGEPVCIRNVRRGAVD